MVESVLGSTEPVMFDLEKTKERLQNLGPHHRAAFAAAVAERLLPNYAAFQEGTGWGNYELLRQAMNEIWAALSDPSGNTSGERIAEALREGKRLVPDLDDRFDSDFAPSAQDAAIALLAAASTLRTGTAADATTTAEKAIDTMDAWMDVEDPERPEFDEQRIREHPLMAAELQKQDRDLTLLEGNEIVSRRLLEELKESSAAMGARLTESSSAGN
jgi:uncharacterized protein YjaG (DUF416 family)